jgi:hypothetical protein
MRRRKSSDFEKYRRKDSRHFLFKHLGIFNTGFRNFQFQILSSQTQAHSYNLNLVSSRIETLDIRCPLTRTLEYGSSTGHCAGVQAGHFCIPLYRMSLARHVLHRRRLSLLNLNDFSISADKLAKLDESCVLQCLKWTLAIDALDSRRAAELRILRTCCVRLNALKPGNLLVHRFLAGKQFFVALTLGTVNPQLHLLLFRARLRGCCLLPRRGWPRVV